jgi:hypothetical protein
MFHGMHGTRKTSVFARMMLAGLLFSPGFSSSLANDEMTSTLLIGKARIDVRIEASPLRIQEKDVMDWVKLAAESVTAYYGHFPVPQVSLRITPFEGKGVRHGMTFGDHGGRITIHVGNQTSQQEFASDWMLTHEMVHLSFPSMADEHHWIEEGIATYVEPIARIQAGHLKAEQMWSDLVRDMPQGLPKDGDGGLDHTHTWGRTYWGGALFCFLADVEIRKQTHNAKGLQQALRGIMDAGGDIRKDWSIEDALREGDRSVGVNVLLPLYEKMKDKPMDVDLGAMWAKLGIQADATGIHFNDKAELADVRRAITSTESSSASRPSSSMNFAVFAGRSAESR